jgi:CubicO group peptidase (beta-lactamase class C family)
MKFTMKFTTTFTLSLLLTFAVAAQTNPAEWVEKAARSRSPRGAVVIDGDLGRKLDDFLQQQFEQGFSGAALVVQGGKTILHKGYGFADRENDLLNRPETVFSIGSITKDFTLAAILKLEEEGSLSVYDDISKYLDGMPEDKRAINIDQLLQHKAGLQEYHDRGEFEYLTYEQAMARIMSQELLFEPGEGQSYSNPGYAVLAAVIEKASGKSYKEYILDEIIAPAGMRNAAFFSQKERMQEDRIALGYDGRQFGERNSPYYWVASWQNMGAGGLVMTLQELYDWRQALDEGKVLGEQARQQFLETYNPASPAPWGGTVRAFAGGNDHGFNMIYLELPEQESFLLLASNTMYRRAERFARDLTRLFLGEEVEAPAPVRSEPFTLRNAEEWGLPETPAGKTAAKWLNALCGQEEAGRRSFVQEYYGSSLNEQHSAEDHVNFLHMIYTFLQGAPEIQDLQAQSETALTFRMYSAQTGERIKVELEVEGEAPHRIVKILVGD